MCVSVCVCVCVCVCVKWINNKVLLCSTENYIQYPMIKHNGKEYIKRNISIMESLHCTAVINITL